MIQHDVPTSAASAERGLPRRGRRAFTIIELLVAVAIIIILLSLLVVAISAASRAGQRANTQALMNSIAKGLERFKADIGYYPPVLGPSASPVLELRRHFVPPVQGAGGYQAAVQDWYSTAAMADYLVGWDNHWLDGYGAVQTSLNPDALHDWGHETPASGIRHPGDDGLWGAENNTAYFRMGGNGGGNPNNSWNRSENSALPIDRGQVFGPYLEISDNGIMGSTDGTFDSLGNLRVFFPGEAGYNASGPMVICDYWGVPIRYFRRPFPPGAIGQSYRANTDINRDGAVDRDDIVPTLSDIYLLRPWQIKPGTESINRFADGDGKTATTRNLDAAEFALFSSGPDKTYNAGITVDPDERNKDNLVELGP